MALFRISCAFGLLLAVAPDPTLQAVRQVLGMAEGAPAQAASPSEAALAFCRAQPDLCLEAARRALQAPKPAKP
jgi:aryl-alcohol dehydrogenase-like predicted oxidoreductase